MAANRRKLLYDLHSWLGAFVGLSLYAVCFSGVVALFDAELEPWVHSGGEPVARGQAAPAALDAALAFALAARPGGDFTLRLPSPHRLALEVRAGRESARFDPLTGAGLLTAGEGPNGVLTRFHGELLLPAAVGRPLVAGLGVTMLTLVITGVVLHRKWLAELFTLRLYRSRRLRCADLHRSVGLWGLPFHAMIAFTGAVLGFSGYALVAAVLTSTGGDQAAAMAAMGMGPPKAAAAISAEAPSALPLAELLARAAAGLPDFTPETMVVKGYGAPNGMVEAFGHLPGRLVYYPSVTLSTATGAVIRVTDWSRESWGRRLYAMTTPLHYASYGGIWLKVLYAALGAGGCFMAISGLRLLRLRPGGEVGGLARFGVGVVWGLPAATAALFWLHAAAAPADQALLFLVLWAAAALGPWLFGADAAAQGLAWLTGLSLASTPLVFAARAGGVFP